MHRGAAWRCTGVQPGVHTVAAWRTHGCSLEDTRLQPGGHTAAAWRTHGCSLEDTRLQPGRHTVAAWRTHGCSLEDIRLQPGCKGCRPADLRLPVGSGGVGLAPGGELERESGEVDHPVLAVEGHHAGAGGQPAVLDRDGELLQAGPTHRDPLGRLAGTHLGGDTLAWGRGPDPGSRRRQSCIGAAGVRCPWAALHRAAGRVHAVAGRGACGCRLGCVRLQAGVACAPRRRPTMWSAGAGRA